MKPSLPLGNEDLCNKMSYTSGKGSNYNTTAMTFV